MKTCSWYHSSFDNTCYGFIRCSKVKPEIVHCNVCGYGLSFIYHKKQLCPQCLNYVYPTKRDEFKEKLRLKIKEKENEK